MWLRLTGGMPEKFIGRAQAAGVRIAQCRRTARNAAEICVRRRDVPAVRALAEQYGVGCDVIRRQGMSALAEAALRRRTALAGVTVMLAVTALMLSRVWMVEVRAADAADEALLARARQVLAEGGAQTGASLRTLDRAQLRARLICELPDAGYAAVRREGVCIVAEISQAVTPPRTYDIGAARDVIALYDGVIERVDVFAGTAAVQPGDFVQRGDLLIEGSERLAGGETGAVAAEGVVMARLWRSAEARIDMEETVQIPTGRSSVAEKLRLWRWEIGLSEAEEYTCAQTRTGFLPVGGLFLPVGVERTTFAECREKRIPRDEAAAKRLLLEEAAAILEENMPFGARVIDKWQDYSMIDSGILYMKLTYELEADIAASGRTE